MKRGRELRHSQDKPLIAVCFNLEQLTLETIDLYRPGIKLQNDIIHLENEDNGDNVTSNRKNFKVFFEHNYRKYLFTTTIQQNPNFYEMCRNMITKELLQVQALPRNEMGEISEEEFKSFVPQFARMIGENDE